MIDVLFLTAPIYFLLSLCRDLYVSRNRIGSVRYPNRK